MFEQGMTTQPPGPAPAHLHQAGKIQLLASYCRTDLMPCRHAQLLLDVLYIAAGAGLTHLHHALQALNCLTHRQQMRLVCPTFSQSISPRQHCSMPPTSVQSYQVDLRLNSWQW